MRQAIKFLIIVIIGFYTQLYAEDQKGLVFNKKIHNFGIIEKHTKVSTVFYYTNKTSKVLEIKVHPRCGCTVPRISKKILKPNEFGEMTITFHAGSYRGNVKKSVGITTIPPIQPPPPGLHILASIVPPYIYLQPSKLFISKLTNTIPFNKTFKILSKVYTNFKINSITYNSNNINVKVNSYKNTNQNVSGYVFNITLFPEKLKKTAILKKNQRGIRTRYFSENIRIHTYAKKTKYLGFSIQGWIY